MLLRKKMHAHESNHHLYSIHILVIIPRRVVDAFGSRSLSFFRACRLLSPTPATFRFFYHIELGRRLRCRGQTAQVLRLFPSPTYIYFILYLYHFIRYSMLHTFLSPNSSNTSHDLLEFALV